LQRTTEIALSTLFLLLLFFQIQDHVFFWDTIQLGSKHAHFFYETNFSSLILPEEIDSGHPPLLGLLLAAAWSLFGKSLAVSHWLMFPFVWGIVYLLFQLGDVFLGKKRAFLLVLLCMLDPMLAGQAILISPDLILVFGFLLGWWSILKKKTWGKILAALLLAALSTRGMMVVVILFLADLYEVWLNEKKVPFKDLISRFLHYVPSGLLGLAFLGYHYLETGWVGYHAGSEWAPSFERVDFTGLLKNLVVLGWRMLDFGRVFLWIILIVLLFRNGNLFKKLSIHQKRTLFLFAVSTLFLSITFLSYKGLQQNRYLLPAVIGFNLLFVVCIKAWLFSVRVRSFIFLISIIALLTGNLWIYPDKISQGWDSTLAHWPYYSLRGKMLDYLEESEIPFEEVGTAFPEIGPLKYKDLSSREEGMVEKNLEQQSYVLYSNVINDFSDEEIDELRKKWNIRRKFNANGIHIILYVR
jgi:hypothetical protein